MITSLIDNINRNKRFYIDFAITVSSSLLILYCGIFENYFLLISVPFLILRFCYLYNTHLLREQQHATLTTTKTLPDFSIIICSYNEKEENITALLDSIFNSTSQAKEIIIVDDCSLQPVRVKEAHVNKVRIIRNETNLGLRRSQIIGISALQPTDYVLCIDSDICFDNLAIETSLQFIRMHADGNVFGVRITLKDFKDDFLNTYINTSYHSNYYKRLFESRMGATVNCNGAFMFAKYSFIISVLEAYRNDSFLGKPMMAGEDKSITNMALQQGKSYTIYGVAVTHERFTFDQYKGKVQRTFKTGIIYQVRAIFLKGVSGWVRLFSALDVISFFLSVPLQVVLLVTLLQLRFFYVLAAIYLIALMVRNKRSIVKVISYSLYRFAMGIYLYLLKLYALLRIRSMGWGTR